VRGTVIDSTVVFDTNLPLGRYEQSKDPVWLRSQLRISAPSGDTRYVTEQALAAAAKPTGAAPATPSGGGTGSAAGSKIADAANKAARDKLEREARSLPGSSYIPSLGGLFGGGGGSSSSKSSRSSQAQPKARPTMLLIVITPAIVGPTGRDVPEPGA
jgi:hypothetical protein